MQTIDLGLKSNLFSLLILVLLTFISPEIVFSQVIFKAEITNNDDVAGHQADRWFFGQNAGLDFRSQDPVADLSNYLLNVPTSIEYATYSNTVEIINYQQISDYSDPSFYSVYPNPGDGNIRLMFKKEMKEAVVSVKNMIGQQVWGPMVFDGLEINEEVRIELPDLREGIYMIQVNGQNADFYVSRYILKR